MVTNACVPSCICKCPTVAMPVQMCAIIIMCLLGMVDEYVRTYTSCMMCCLVEERHPIYIAIVMQ